MAQKQVKMDEIVALCKNRGFIFPGSEIYGGLANSWDYGPLGVELINNIKKAFWEFFVYGREDIAGLDSAILMNPKVWEASGHVGSFTDPLVDCNECKHRFRGDKLIEERYGMEIVPLVKNMVKNEIDPFDKLVQWNQENNHSAKNLQSAKKATLIDLQNLQSDPISLVNYILKKDANVICPACGKFNWTFAKEFNLMYKTYQGVTEGSVTEIYLRPETAQGIFVNFQNVQRTTRKKLPFGIAQIGKAFRNEITPGNFTFRTREFEQMEIEYFFDPEKNDWQKLFAEWKETTVRFVRDILGINPENYRLRDHEADELSHYSKGTTDIEYRFPFGWGELCATGAYRTDYDLSQHQKHSGENMEYRDEESGRKLIPHVIEPSLGVGRLALAILLDAHTVEQLEDGSERSVMKFLPRIAPVKVAVFPLMKKDNLPEKAREIIRSLRLLGNVQYDEAGSVGKRYRRHDEIGTPVCVTIDYDTLQDETVTVRDRDTMKQERVKIGALPQYLGERYF